MPWRYTFNSRLKDVARKVIYEPVQNKAYKITGAACKDSDLSAIWSESSLDALWVAKCPKLLYRTAKPDQTTENSYPNKFKWQKIVTFFRQNDVCYSIQYGSYWFPTEQDWSGTHRLELRGVMYENHDPCLSRCLGCAWRKWWICKMCAFYGFS